jgi:hypothetical protein
MQVSSCPKAQVFATPKALPQSHGDKILKLIEVASLLKMSPIFFAWSCLEFGLISYVSDHPCSPAFRQTTRKPVP